MPELFRSVKTATSWPMAPPCVPSVARSCAASHRAATPGVLAGVVGVASDGTGVVVDSIGTGVVMIAAVVALAVDPDDVVEAPAHADSGKMVARSTTPRMARRRITVNHPPGEIDTAKTP